MNCFIVFSAGVPNGYCPGLVAGHAPPGRKLSDFSPEVVASSVRVEPLGLIVVPMGICGISFSFSVS
jgi:hypothetical protein